MSREHLRLPMDAYARLLQGEADTLLVGADLSVLNRDQVRTLVIHDGLNPDGSTAWTPLRHPSSA